MTTADAQRLDLAQLGLPRGLESLRSRLIATLCAGIGHVLSMCCEKQMVWSDTRRVVAMVSNLQSAGDRTEVQLPRKPVSVNAPLFGANYGVSVAVVRARPDPAPILDNAYTLPEPFGDRDSFLARTQLFAAMRMASQEVVLGVFCQRRAAATPAQLMAHHVFMARLGGDSQAASASTKTYRSMPYPEPGPVPVQRLTAAARTEISHGR